MWASKIRTLSCLSLALGLLLLGTTPSVEAIPLLTTSVTVQSLSIDSNPPLCNANPSSTGSGGTVTSSDSCSSGQSSVTGSARASFGSLGVEVVTSSTVNVVNSPVILEDAIGVAEAISRETLTLANVPTSGFLFIHFALDGTLEFAEEVVPTGTFTNNFANIELEVSNATAENRAYKKSLGTIGTAESGELFFSLPYIGTGASTAIADLEITLRAVSRCGLGGAGTVDFTCSASASYLTSATVTGLDILDMDMKPVLNAMVTSESGFDYQAGFSQQPNPVPEPSTMLLFGSGLAGLIAWRYRKEKLAKN